MRTCKFTRSMLQEIQNCLVEFVRIFNHWKVSALVEDYKLGIWHPTTTVFRVFQGCPNIFPTGNYQSWQLDLLQPLNDAMWSNQLDIHEGPSCPFVSIERSGEGISGQLYDD